MTNRNVQTVLPQATYDALAQAARTQARPIKAVVRDAIESYLRDARRPGGRDSFLDFIGSGSLPAGNWSERKDWRA